MAPFNIPPDGVVVRHGSKDDPNSKQTTPVVRLDLIESVTKDILRALTNNEQVRLRCGKKPVVQFGKKTISLQSSVDSFPSEIFTKSTKHASPLYFTGKASHRLEVRQAEEDTAKADGALATLESTLKSIQEERASNETSLKEGTGHGAKKAIKRSPLLGQGSALRKEHFLGSLNRSTPGSPFLNTSYSPRLGPTSVPLGGGLSAKDRVRLDAIRIPMVHLLAVRPMTPKAICDQLHATPDDIEKLIDKVSWESKAEEGKRELKEKIYRELDVWKFPYRSKEDRQAAIDHAIQAYDRTRVEKKDPLWQLLLPPEERGKGKILSKLNFDKPVTSHATPKAGDDGNESKNESDRDHTKIRPRKNKETAVAEKARKDKVAGSRSLGVGETTTTSRAKDKGSRPAKAETKFKSSERIIDSDEEAEAADIALAKSKKQDAAAISKTSSPVKRKPEHDQPKSNRSPVPTASAKKPVHKSSLSSLSSSSSNTSGNDRHQSGTTNSSTSLKPQSNHQRTESSGSRISPRPRHDSSPQKPSPLGSSPPTTSTDLDNSSSSKASNQSSAPSSPPSGTDMPQTRAGNKYSPIISDKSRNVSRGRSPGPSAAKRKTDPSEDARPAKRQQQQPQQDARPRSTHLKPLTNGEHHILKRPTGPVRTDSERSSSPEKQNLNRDAVIEEARRFQKYYKRYKELHVRLAQIDEKDRDDKDMNDLLKMHHRLKEMKADIWANWEKVENMKVGKNETNGDVREMLAV
jgi:RNA polymerase II elongation factor ELL